MPLIFLKSNIGYIITFNGYVLLGAAQPVIPPNLYSLMLMNIIAWGPQVRIGATCMNVAIYNVATTTLNYRIH